MTLRIKIMLLAVALLVAVNIWRWSSRVEPVESQNTTSHTAEPQAMTLNLAGYEPVTGERVEVKRDIFSPLSDVQPETIPVEETRQEEKTPAGPSRRETTLQELEQYKLVGILSRNGVKQGFLVRDEKNFTVRRGDRLEKRFSVDEITLTSVTLSDPGSRVSRKIELE